MVKGRGRDCVKRMPAQFCTKVLRRGDLASALFIEPRSHPFNTVSALRHPKMTMDVSKLYVWQYLAGVIYRWITLHTCKYPLYIGSHGGKSMVVGTWSLACCDDQVSLRCSLVPRVRNVLRTLGVTKSPTEILSKIIKNCYIKPGTAVYDPDFDSIGWMTYPSYSIDCQVLQ